ncbi:hypothetical protein B4U79_04983 [Dinothrombium tinctorium]|uniref:Uncharacterized protein n=1 Tax=Dinothrombium tinctorium TaxID=1965070 RepID=A0A3S3P058_9ACAR|nr:hypothetical protein B4U79_04983 [Dinothrombium tinctorium]
MSSIIGLKVINAFISTVKSLS